MTRLVQIAVLLPCWVLFCLLGRDLIVEALNRRECDSWSWDDRCECAVCVDA